MLFLFFISRPSLLISSLSFFQPALKTPISPWNTRVLGCACVWRQDNDAYREDGTMVMRISRLPPQFSPRSQPNPAFSNVEQCRVCRLCRQKGRRDALRQPRKTSMDQSTPHLPLTTVQSREWIRKREWRLSVLRLEWVRTVLKAIMLH